MVKGGSADAAALDLFHPRHRVQSPSRMAASISEGMKGTVISMDYEHTFGKALVFLKAYGPARYGQFRGAAQIKEDFSLFKSPAGLMGWFPGCTYAEEALEDVPVKGPCLH